eukprot:14978711-Heterocapsa_arctica.AAC.1
MGAHGAEAGEHLGTIRAGAGTPHGCSEAGKDQRAAQEEGLVNMACTGDRNDRQRQEEGHIRRGGFCMEAFHRGMQDTGGFGPRQARGHSDKDEGIRHHLCLLHLWCRGRL